MHLWPAEGCGSAGMSASCPQETLRFIAYLRSFASFSLDAGCRLLLSPDSVDLDVISTVKRGLHSRGCSPLMSDSVLSGRDSGVSDSSPDIAARNLASTSVSTG